MIDSNSCTTFTVVSAFSTPFDEANGSRQQVSGPREYRIQDVWGDDPVELPALLSDTELASPASSAANQSWPRRLLIRLFGPLLIEPTVEGEHSPGKASASGASLNRTSGQLR